MKKRNIYITLACLLALVVSLCGCSPLSSFRKINIPDEMTSDYSEDTDAISGEAGLELPTAESPAGGDDSATSVSADDNAVTDASAEDDVGNDVGVDTIAAKDTDNEQPETQSVYIPDENENYYDLENVVLYLDRYGKLPPNFITKKEAQALGWEGGSVENFSDEAALGGNHYGNYEKLLPDGKYLECDIDTHNKKGRGAKRLVYSDDGRYYYTDDHYESFRQVFVKNGVVEIEDR